MNINFQEKLALYIPNSTCTQEDTIRLTFDAAEQIFPILVNLIDSLGRSPEIETMDIFSKSESDKLRANQLAELLNRHGSDKAARPHHDYELLYADILKDPESVECIFEVGMGTNNPLLASTMGLNGSPGASLRAFRDFCPNAQIYGADFDRNILFQEDRIATFFVDQTRRATLRDLFDQLPEMDMIIDDGLHSPYANIQMLEFALGKIKVGGTIVVEDIGNASVPVWSVVQKLLPDSFESTIVKSCNNHIFVVKRLV